MNRNITAFILIVLAVGMYLTVTSGIVAQANAVQSVNAQYQAAIASSLKLIQVRDKVLADYNNLSADDRARLAKMLPNSVDNIRLIIDLNNLALRHGFTLKNVSAKTSDSVPAGQPPVRAVPQVGGGASMNQAAIPALNGPTLDTINVSFGLSAPYQQFQSFLQDLEADLRIMDVTHLSVTANPNGIYDWNLDLQTYWLRQQ
ncbi:MAG: hypothetical protein KGI45_00860 [Patescibacteria group bacterium]|nr:hypothetical protein [Patescibacteria group bacterium]MDE1966607.1 hypothetical protein [Patescibacteria group bacterium]